MNIDLTKTVPHNHRNKNVTWSIADFFLNFEVTKESLCFFLT